MGAYKGVMGGVESMVASRFTPWHYSYNEDRVKLTDLTIESGRQALTMAGCDWRVNKVSLAEWMPEHEGAEDFSLLLRSDRPALLGVQSASYTVIDNEKVADLADAVVESMPGACVESAGALFAPGKVVWMLVRLPDASVRFGSDGSEHHERYVLVSTTHDGTGALTVRGTDVRVECMNTISMAWSGSRAEYVIRHTTNALNYVEEAKRGLVVASANWQAMDERIEDLLDTPLDFDDFKLGVLPAVLGARPDDAGRAQTNFDNRFAAIVDAYMADHNEAIADTAWGAVNAVNEYEEWGMTTRGRERWEAQFSRLLSGSYDLTSKTLAVVS